MTTFDAAKKSLETVQNAIKIVLRSTVEGSEAPAVAGVLAWLSAVETECLASVEALKDKGDAD